MVRLLTVEFHSVQGQDIYRNLYLPTKIEVFVLHFVPLLTVGRENLYTGN